MEKPPDVLLEVAVDSGELERYVDAIKAGSFVSYHGFKCYVVKISPPVADGISQVTLRPVMTMEDL